MPCFDFQAVDAAGNWVAGSADARDEADLREQLRHRGLELLHMVVFTEPTHDSADRLERLSTSDAEEVLGHLASTSLAETSLVAGLQAAAAGASNRRVAAALQYLAATIGRGRPMDEALAEASGRMPAHVSGLVAAATRTGSLGPALDELTDHHRKLRAMFWSIWGSLAYPLLVLALSAIVVFSFMLWIVPQFESMFTEFELKLPAATESLLVASRSTRSLVYGPTKWLLFLILVGMAVGVYLSASGRGGANVQRMLGLMPVLGPLWAWSGAASFMTLLSTLLEHSVPLPEALRLTGDGMDNAELRRAAARLADGVRGGQGFAQLVESTGCLPASSVPLLRWGEQTGALADATSTLAEMFADRLAARTAWIRSTSPPVIYLFVVLTIGFAITSLFMPLVSLIQGLS